MNKTRSTSRKSYNRDPLSVQIAERIREQIRRKQLSAGTFLGTEADLASQYGVSRTVIREAIGHLRGLGVVASRQGHGLSVANGDMIDVLAKAFDSFPDHHLKKSSLAHLRFILEVGSVPLAAERATPEQIQQLRRLAEEMDQLVSEHPGATMRRILPALLKKEIAFHQMLFTAAGNNFARRFHELLIDYFHETYTPRYAPQLDNKVHMKEHLQLVDAIEARDAARAVSILIRHLRTSLVEEE